MITKMKRKRRALRAFEKFKFNRLIPVLVILFLAGMIYGAFTVGFTDAEQIENLSFITSGFTNERASQSIFITLGTSLLSSGLLLLILFFLGFFAIGHPLTFFIPFFRGLGLGMSMGYFYLYHGMKGVAFCAVLLLPHAIISTLVIIMGARESIRMSNMFLSMIFGKTEKKLAAIKLYIIKFAVLFIGIVIAALVDCIMTFIFARFFIF